ncbi:non-hydrolyzing UDP-N-acetylglucosamine 2-epimerase [Halorientalis brevis]|uniref:Non-hydrolyzing UDP-N-acetylglucosamine 2-epimerase n=1 Tax=Halorientalis brevis TaxID=1126241 RepID=A0ABD6CEV6_9EURY|nr:UDP-N-acetylglucosamine 2-epimerase (non-hydrolyzing) [Halorientalis brevis]
MKVLTIVGARSQLLESFPVSQALRDDHDEVVVYTGENYTQEMGESFFDVLSVPEPDVTLGLESRSDAEQTASLLSSLDDLVETHAPDVVLVYGDTNATLAGALVGAKRDVLVAHIEAGLRDDDRSQPDEINRVLADHCSGLLFVPSERAKHFLADEGITDGVYDTGDVMYDALRIVREQARSQSGIVSTLGREDDEYILAALHRASSINDGDRLRSIVEGLGAAPRPVLLPSHPRLDEALERYGLASDLPEGVNRIDRVGYLDYIRLLDGAERVATDAGRVQKEAFYLDTPCVTLRERTAWLATVTCGWNVLVGTDPDAISRNLDRSFDVAAKPNPYGDGSAAEQIVSALESERLSVESNNSAEKLTS